MTPLTCEDNQSNMPVAHSAVRDTFFYASDHCDTLLGGLYSPGMTNNNFHSIVQMVCVISDTFELRDDNGLRVERDDEQLRPGNYYIATNGRSFLLVYFHH